MVTIAEVQDFAAPLSGLFGVFIGGVITYGVEVRREKRAREREQRAEAAEAKATARVVHAALRRQASIMEVHAAEDPGTYWEDEIAERVFTPVDPAALQELARHLSTEEWQKLRVGLAFSDTAVTHRRLVGARTPLSESERERLREWHDTVLAAAEALCRVAQVPARETPKH